MTFLDPYSAQFKSILRIVAGLLFFSEGVAKILHFPLATPFAMVHPLDWPEGFAGCIELFFGGLVMLGLYGRIAAFICSGEMAVAYFIGHFPKGIYPIQNGGIAAILYCFIFLYLAAAGPGPWAVNQK